MLTLPLLLAGLPLGVLALRHATNRGPRVPGAPAHHRARGFANLHHVKRSVRGPGQALELPRSFIGRDARAELGRARHLQVSSDPEGQLAACGEADSVSWIGHASSYLRLRGTDGVQRGVLLDPVWSPRCAPAVPGSNPRDPRYLAGPVRYTAPGLRLEQLPRVDLVVVSHDHYDHLDEPSIRLLERGPRPHYITPLKVGAHLRRFGVPAARITELDWWQSHHLLGLTVHCTPAQHFSGRGPHDRNATLWASFVLEGADSRIFFSGDTAASPVFDQIGRQLGPFDVALVAIGAYQPSWFMSPVHCSPKEALQIAQQVQARSMIGIHWGAWILSAERIGDPAEELLAAAGQPDVPPGYAHIFGVGESRRVAELPVR